MNERTIYIYQTDITGKDVVSFDVSRGIVHKIAMAISDRPELIGAVFHDKETGNFYKAVYSI